MCGRYALTLPPDAVRSVFAYAEQPNFPPRWNIAPTQPVPVVTAAEGARRFTLMRWGFLPSWVKDPKAFPLVINVRSETAREKPSFRNALKRRRCLMPADGFYEWHRVGSENRAYLFRRPDRGAFAFAALHETWSGADGSEIDTVALLNSHANGLMSAVHHRCPVIVDPGQYEAWLAPDAEPGEIDQMLMPPPDDLLEMIRIGPAVNKVAHDGPEVQLPYVALPAPREEPSPTPRKARPARGNTSGQGSLF
jgi:putative SOS response-associated peptidase YedK